VTPATVKAILLDIQAAPFGSKYQFEIEDRNGVMLMSTYVESDIGTGLPAMQRTRKWFISEHATASEIVQTALKCVLTSAEHRVRESFTYGGKRCYGPHFHVNALAAIAESALDRRTAE
jgi:hypothetical protein